MHLLASCRDRRFLPGGTVLERSSTAHKENFSKAMRKQRAAYRFVIQHENRYRTTTANRNGAGDKTKRLN